ncbi:hypothetical protein HMPREF2829_07435 [Aerococcus sp. HMSC072A12]|nr:hypothetical protein HMPREF2829_07435 [Aerococcus sp. HMSC072A12]OFT39366.1 hypothetical protein HMPREF3161_06775 [Aerococcus sp. HMSC06H08]
MLITNGEPNTSRGVRSVLWEGLGNRYFVVGAFALPADLLTSQEIENIFDNTDFVLMLNQASGDRDILAKKLKISPYQLNYITNSNAGEGLLFFGNTIVPFIDKFPKDTMLYKLMTTKPEEAK